MVSPRRQLLADLANHPGWQELGQVVLEQKDAYFRNLAQTLYNDPAGVTPDALHYKRGFFKGMVWLLANPKVELRELRKELDKDGDPV